MCIIATARGILQSNSFNEEYYNQMQNITTSMKTLAKKAKLIIKAPFTLYRIVISLNFLKKLCHMPTAMILRTTFDDNIASSSWMIF